MNLEVDRLLEVNEPLRCIGTALSDLIDEPSYTTNRCRAVNLVYTIINGFAGRHSSTCEHLDDSENRPVDVSGLLHLVLRNCGVARDMATEAG